MSVIDNFDGGFSFLSNFFDSAFNYNGAEWPTSEHAYQAMKTLDAGEQESVRMSSTPGRAKRAGKKVTKRADWDNVKVGIMEDVVFSKFDQNEALKSKLISTGDALIVEGNTWNDTFWGVCRGVGDNNLGKVLMRVRDKIGFQS